jgi:deazaflavin-dependent oxidoreductase (nitroreductase family)
MPVEGDYLPGTLNISREQVAAYEASGGEQANTLLDTGFPIVIVTTRGNRSGKVRKVALMRVEHEGAYALVASLAGAPKNPVWYYNLLASPTEVTIQDGPEPFDAVVHLAEGTERALWWARAVHAYPPYSEYQERTERQIPLFVARPSA